MSENKVRTENGIKVADVTFDLKPYVVKELKVKKLREIMATITEDESSLTEGNAVENIDQLIEVVKKMYPDVDPEDIENAYTSELWEAFNLWQELNFTWLTKEKKST